MKKLCLIFLGLISIVHANISAELKENNIKRAMIFGVTGQDGSYLTEFLLSKGYEVHGVKRRSSSLNTPRVDHIFSDAHQYNKFFFLHYGDVEDGQSIYRLINTIRPQEIYNLAAQSHVAVSFEVPEYTANVTGLGTLRILESIRQIDPKIRFYQAGSSEMYGATVDEIQGESTRFNPRSPYAAAKLFAHYITTIYRDGYGLFATNGILFNHESPRRGETFVTRKIAQAVARIVKGTQDTLYMGNLDSKRDWGSAQDYVEAMWLMLQDNEPGDYILATGETHTVREFIEKAFAHVGISIIWQGKDVDEVGIDKNTGKVLVRVDKKYFRPAEVEYLRGDASKFCKRFNWKPRITFEALVTQMVDAELK